MTLWAESALAEVYGFQHQYYLWEKKQFGSFSSCLTCPREHHTSVSQQFPVLKRLGCTGGGQGEAGLATGQRQLCVHSTFLLETKLYHWGAETQLLVDSGRVQELLGLPPMT